MRRWRMAHPSKTVRKRVDMLLFAIQEYPGLRIESQLELDEIFDKYPCLQEKQP